MPLDQSRLTYKPLAYPWMADAWLIQQQVHWLPNEVPMGDDVRDWNHRLTPPEKNLLTQIFRFFVQSDVEVADNYNERLLRVIKPNEAKLMLTAFSNMEGVHQVAYAHLLESVGMPETEFSAFLDYAEMRAKHDYMQSFKIDTPYEVAKTIAAFGAFMEGLQLFASFAILMNFPRFNKMKGMGQIITWSVRDESLHCDSMVKLFHTWVAEHPEIDRKTLADELRHICRQIISQEEAFIGLAFELGPVDGMTQETLKDYIRYLANLRCRQLKIRVLSNNGPTENPLPWLDSLLTGHEHANFFEARSTEYSKAATKGEWADAYE
jgi:ribonucleoside-diphosphate reductase beta chain